MMIYRQNCTEGSASQKNPLSITLGGMGGKLKSGYNGRALRRAKSGLGQGERLRYYDRNVLHSAFWTSAHAYKIKFFLQTASGIDMNK